jgi:hypothetical protein
MKAPTVYVHEEDAPEKSGEVLVAVESNPLQPFRIGGTIILQGVNEGLDGKYEVTDVGEGGVEHSDGFGTVLLPTTILKLRRARGG